MRVDGTTPLKVRERAVIREIDPALMEELISPFSSPQGSRFIGHAGNLRAVDALEAMLATLRLPMVRRVSRRFFLNGDTGYNVIAELTGRTKALVIVGAHLDSTGGDDPLFRRSFDLAPGADDDASGMAAVLAIAKIMRKLASGGAPKRTIQFAFFNAEEVGRIGSKQYARNVAARRGRMPVEAMIQLDAIGFCPPGESRGWEIHAGHRDATTQAAAVEIASLIAAHRGSLPEPTLLPAEIVTARVEGGRYAVSDHVSFQDRGIPACVVTQGYTAGPGEAGAGNRNPHLHSTRDTLDKLNLGYMAAITRVVAAAVWTIANR